MIAALSDWASIECQKQGTRGGLLCSSFLFAKKTFCYSAFSAIDGNREEFPLSSPVTELTTGLSDATTPEASRSIVTGVAGAGQAQTDTGDEYEIFGSKMESRVLRALSSMREVIQSTTDSMDRNNDTFSMVVHVSTDASRATPSPFENISRSSAVVASGLPMPREFSEPVIREGQEPSEGQEKGPELQGGGILRKARTIPRG